MVGRGTSRRSFIAGAVGATVGLPLFGSTAAAQAGGVNMTAWRLDPDWGFARGPNNKTRLFSNASRQAAAHRWAIAEADALDMNLHLGSWAPAVQVLVDRTAFMQMFDAAGYVWQNPWKNVGVRILDDRHVTRVPDGAAIWARAMNPITPAVFVPPTTAPETPASIPAPAAATRSPAPTPALALTGADVPLRAAMSVGLVATGAAFVRIARRRQQLLDERGEPREGLG